MSVVKSHTTKDKKYRKETKPNAVPLSLVNVQDS